MGGKAALGSGGNGGNDSAVEVAASRLGDSRSYLVLLCATNEHYDDLSAVSESIYKDGHRGIGKKAFARTFSFIEVM